MNAKEKSRLEIESMIESDNLSGLLKKAGEFHGHHCNYLACGIIAGL